MFGSNFGGTLEQLWKHVGAYSLEHAREPEAHGMISEEIYSWAILNSSIYPCSLNLLRTALGHYMRVQLAEFTSAECTCAGCPSAECGMAILDTLWRSRNGCIGAILDTLWRTIESETWGHFWKRFVRVGG